MKIFFSSQSYSSKKSLNFPRISVKELIFLFLKVNKELIKENK